MAVITKQELEDASVDAYSLERIVNGSATENGTGLVTTRLGQQVKTVAKIASELATQDIGGMAAAQINQRVDAVQAELDAAPIVAPGKNLLDHSASSLDTILNSAGSLSTQSGWATSSHIPVTPNTTLSVNTQRFCAEYDANKVFISGTFFDPVSPAARTFTTNANTRFLRVTYSKTASVQVEYGSSVTTYEAYKERVRAPDGGPLLADNTENVHPSLVNVVADIATNRQYGEDTYFKQKDLKLETSNLIKAFNIGYILGVGGALAAQSGWKTSDYVAVSPSTSYAISVVRFLAFYDSNKVLIGTLTSQDPQTQLSVTSPSNAAFMRVTAGENSYLYANQGTTLSVPVTHVRAFEQLFLPELRASLRAWMRSESYTVTSTITYRPDGRPVSPLNIVWPNGATGTLSLTYNTDGTVSELTATHVLNGLSTTIKQPAITYTNGLPSQIPAITIF